MAFSVVIIYQNMITLKINANAFWIIHHSVLLINVYD